MKCNTVKLGEIASVKGGKRLPKGKSLVSEKTDHPYIRIRDLEQKMLEITPEYEYIDSETQKAISKYIVDKNDIVISIVGTIGLVGIVGESLNGANLTENCAKLTSLDITRIDLEFLYYFLVSELGQGEIKRGTVGAVQPKLPLKNIQAIEIPLPSLKEQQTIGALLKTLDDKIELNNRINENLKQQAQTIYSSMFLNTQTDGWERGTLSDIAEITMGQSPSGSSYNEEGNGTVFFQGRAEFGFRFPTIRLYTTEPKRMARKNDVLMSVRAPVGDLNVAHEDCCIGRGLGAIHSKDNHQSFVLYTLFSLQKQLDVFNGEGTVFGSINRDSLNSLPIIIPPIEIIDEFERIVAPMDELILSNYDANCRLVQIRDSLLPKLMSGELDVSEIDL